MDEKGGGPTTVQQVDENGYLSSVFEGSTTQDISIRKFNQQKGLSTWMDSSSGDVLQQLINVFLPTGYPNSVSSDYIDYQIYDSIQAFSSSIASLFANRCVLSAVGVGDDSATSTSALFMKIIQETVGRCGTILFAWKLGSTLEPECKKYRYVADLVNDTATVFDCLSPLFPGSKNKKVVMLCISGLLRSICGVFAGASRAALTLHFTDPRKGSIADVNAKDQSQETVITLMGMLTGSVVVGIVKGEGFHMWVTVLSLLAVHLWTNYQAVWHVVMRTLNRQRCNIVFSDIVSSLPEFERTSTIDADSTKALSKLVLSPKHVSAKEKILEPDGLLRWYSVNGRQTIGKAQFGGFNDVISNIKAPLHQLFEACDAPKSGYILSFAVHPEPSVDICLVHDSERSSALRAWVHALIIARELHQNTKYETPLDLIQSTRSLVEKLFDQLSIESALAMAGWEMDKHAVQKCPTPTIKISSPSQVDYGA